MWLSHPKRALAALQLDIYPHAIATVSDFADVDRGAFPVGHDAARFKGRGIERNTQMLCRIQIRSTDLKGLRGVGNVRVLHAGQDYKRDARLKVGRRPFVEGSGYVHASKREGLSVAGLDAAKTNVTLGRISV